MTTATYYRNVARTAAQAVREDETELDAILLAFGLTDTADVTGITGDEPTADEIDIIRALVRKGI